MLTLFVQSHEQLKSFRIAQIYYSVTIISGGQADITII